MKYTARSKVFSLCLESCAKLRAWTRCRNIVRYCNYQKLPDTTSRYQQNHFCEWPLGSWKKVANVYIWPFMFRRLKKYWGWHKSKLKGNSFTPTPPPATNSLMLWFNAFHNFNFCWQLIWICSRIGMPQFAQGARGDPLVINIQEIFW